MSARARLVLLTTALVAVLLAVVLVVLLERDDSSADDAASGAGRAPAGSAFTADADGYVALACSLNDDRLAAGVDAFDGKDPLSAEALRLLRTEAALLQAAGEESQEHPALAERGRQLAEAISDFDRDGVRDLPTAIDEDCTGIDRVPTDPGGREVAVCRIVPRISSPFQPGDTARWHELDAAETLATGTRLDEHLRSLREAVNRFDEDAWRDSVTALASECDDR